VHLAALADEAGRAPRAHRAHRRGAGVGRRGGVERLVRASPSVRSRIAATTSPACGSSTSCAPNCLGELSTLCRDHRRDDARAHDYRELRRRQTDRALAEDGDRLAALRLSRLQRTPGRAGAARDGRTGDERERIR
jgi:hypothetical protein